MKFKAVHLPADRALDHRASQTLLKHFERCPRSGYLYQLHKGEASTMEMVRGTAAHLAIQRAVETMVEQGEPTIPGDLMKAIVNETLAELPVPVREHDYIRESCYRWASEWTIDPAAVIACETLVVLNLGGWQVRCKIDFAEALTGGLVVRVADWKSSRAAPSFDDLARKRPDATLAARNFQLILYALALCYGRPVRVEECTGCHGAGRVRPLPPTKTGGDHECPMCHGRGRVEIVEPFALAGQAERFDLELVFPGIENREGLMLRRPVSLTRLELGEYRETLIALLKRLETSEQTGDWPAVISDEACSECPARRECPIPRELRDHAGEINTLEQAAQAAEVLDRRSDENAALRKEIKLWLKAHEGEVEEIRYGRNKAWRFGYSESDRIERKDEMFAAIQRAVDYGEPFERSRFVRTVQSTTFTAVTLSDEELDAERAA